MAKYGLLLLLVITAYNSFAQARYSNIIIFGDSLSDTGNLAGNLINLPFPYYNNRISDGPVAVDYVTAEFNHNARASKHLFGRHQGYNYAIAGGNIVGNDPEDLNSQISAYLSRNNRKADTNALYMIIMGGNDLRDISRLTNASIAKQRILNTAATLSIQATRLIKAGAKNIFIANTPNVGRLPETIARENNAPGSVNRAKSYSVMFNQALNQHIIELKRQSSAHIIAYDFYTDLELLLLQAPSLGFRQTEFGCFNSSAFSFHPDCDFGSRFDRFIFFDNIHPTSKSHRWISNRINSAIYSSVKQSNNTIAPSLLLLLK